MSRQLLIPGEILLGFADAFDAAYGDPTTPQPYLRVRPANVGGTLLPFPCPHCGAVRPEAVDPQKRANFTDAERGFSWCPACEKRYVLVLEGAPLATTLEPGATSAPAQIEGRQKVAMVVEEPHAFDFVGKRISLRRTIERLSATGE